MLPTLPFLAPSNLILRDLRPGLINEKYHLTAYEDLRV